MYVPISPIGKRVEAVRSGYFAAGYGLDEANQVPGLCDIVCPDGKYQIETTLPYIADQILEGQNCGAALHVIMRQFAEHLVNVHSVPVTEDVIQTIERMNQKPKQHGMIDLFYTGIEQLAGDYEMPRETAILFSIGTIGCEENGELSEKPCFTFDPTKI